MKDPAIICANERYKAVAAALMQLGTALLAAAVVKAYLEGGLNPEILLWLLGVIALIWIGWLILGLLQVEDSIDDDS